MGGQFKENRKMIARKSIEREFEIIDADCLLTGDRMARSSSSSLVKKGYGHANMQALMVEAMLALGAAIGLCLVVILARSGF